MKQAKFLALRAISYVIKENHFAIFNRNYLLFIINYSFVVSGTLTTTFTMSIDGVAKMSFRTNIFTPGRMTHKELTYKKLTHHKSY